MQPQTLKEYREQMVKEIQRDAELDVLHDYHEGLKRSIWTLGYENNSDEIYQQILRDLARLKELAVNNVMSKYQ